MDCRLARGMLVEAEAECLRKCLFSAICSEISEECENGDTATVDLPESGAKYYKFDVITETSK